MRRVLSVLTSMVAIAVLFTACSKSTDKILTKSDGKWDLDMTYTYSLNGVVVDTDNDKGTMVFDDDKFTMTYSSGDSETGTWSATKDKVTLTTNGISIVLDIIESKRNTQTWEVIFAETDEGDTYENKTVLKLTR